MAPATTNAAVMPMINFVIWICFKDEYSFD
jgi:hypothetical protein